MEPKCPNCGGTEFDNEEVPGDQYYLCSHIIYCTNCWMMIACCWGNK